jgi:protein O-mannosyl-transferase
MNSTEHVSNNCREEALSHCRKLVFAFLSLAIILLAIYGNSFDCSWQFDDDPNITDNPNLHLEEITWQTIRQSLFSDRNNPGFLYRPVACLTIALNYYFGGKDVFGYHAVNLVIHWLSALFLFLFIYHTLNLPRLKQQYADRAYGLALLATVLWAINPVQVQAVTYIVQRMASLAGMFFILTMYL